LEFGRSFLVIGTLQNFTKDKKIENTKIEDTTEIA
jgi:hypothetical protein